MVIRLFVLFAVFFVCSFGYGEEAVEIPLNEIWAYYMPGTKNVTDLDPFYAPPNLTEEERREKSAVRHIIHVLNPSKRRENQKAPPGFAVEGTGNKALLIARDILMNKKKPETEFSPTDETTLVFFSYISGAYFRLDGVVRDGTRITINYHYVRHDSANASVHFGLIPMGRLPKGSYQVDLAMGAVKDDFGGDPEPPPPPKLIEQTVCQDFEFVVK